MSTVDLGIKNMKSLLSHINGINHIIRRGEQQKKRKKHETLRESFSRWFTTVRAKHIRERRMNDLEQMVRMIPKEKFAGHAELLLLLGSVAYKSERYYFGMSCYQLVLEITRSDKPEDHDARMLAYVGNIECGMQKMLLEIARSFTIDDMGYKHLAFQYSFVWEALDSVNPTVREDLKNRLINVKNLMYLFEFKRDALVNNAPRRVEHLFL